MFRLNFLLPTIVCCVILMSCSSQSDVSEIQVVVSPDSVVMHVENEDILPYDIQFNSIKEPITRFQITQRTTKTASLCVFDTILNTQKQHLYFEYKVPSTIYENRIELSFTAKTASDYFTVTKYLLLDTINTQLKESSAHVMYSEVGKTANAFSLSERQIKNYPLDSLKCDIYDYHDSALLQNQLSSEWRSATGMCFARFNDFNYSDATVQSLQNSYSNAQKSTTVNQLKVNDVILIGNKITAKAVVKIIAIFDEAGYQNDRYVFNIKYIP